MKKQYINPKLRATNLDCTDYLLAGAGSNSYDDQVGVASSAGDNTQEVLTKEHSLNVWEEW